MHQWHHSSDEGVKRAQEVFMATTKQRCGRFALDNAVFLNAVGRVIVQASSKIRMELLKTNLEMEKSSARKSECSYQPE